MPAATFKMRNVGQYGVIKDVPAYDLPPSAWSDARNVRFEGGKISKFSGNERVLERFVKDGERTISLHQMRDTRNDVHWLVATDKNIYEISSLTKQKIVSEFDDAYHAKLSEPWTYTNLSNCVIFNNVNDDPIGKRPTEEKFSTLPKWGVVTGMTGEEVKESWRTYNIKSYKNFLLALNTYEEGNEYPQRVRWSDITDVNDLPTNWNSSTTESSAGFNDLTDATGEILEGEPLRDAFIIYTTNDTFSMQYIGGNSIFRFSKLFAGSGILARNCVAEFEGKHFVISKNDIFVHDGSNRKSIVAGRIRDHLIDEITSVNELSVRVFPHYLKREIWVTYCRPGTDLRNEGDWTPNRAAVWNWESDTWTFYDLPEHSDMGLLYPISSDDRKWEDYGLEPGEKPEQEGVLMLKNSWGNQDDFTRWSEIGQNFASQMVLAIGKFGTIYQIDVGEFVHNDKFTPAYDKPDSGINVPISPGVYEFEKQPLIAWFERQQIDFDEIEIPTWGNVKVRKFYPQFRGNGGVYVQLGGTNMPDGITEYKERRHFNIGLDYQIPFRTNQKYISVKFTDDREGEWSFSGFDMDIHTGGVR